MEAAGWGWTYGRDEALRGARSTRARCGARIVTALLEEEAGRRTKRAHDGADAQGSLARSVEGALEGVRVQIRGIAVRLSRLAATFSACSSVPAPDDDVAHVEWIDLRPLRARCDEGVRRMAMGSRLADGDGLACSLGEAKDLDEDASAACAKFGLWRALAMALARHRAALAFAP